MTNRILCMLAMLALCLPASGQGRTHRRGDRTLRYEEMKLAATSVDASADTVAIMKMRARMDSIRSAEGRPTVAVVLSGGGAKGAAHVGVLKYLEEQQIPIDMILGTSMGGLVGGMYSLGYSAASLDTLLRSLDWSVMLTDKVDMQYVPYKTKMRRQKYFFSMPFHYAKEDFAAKVGDGVRYSARKANVHISAAQEEDLIDGAAATTSFNSLPSGYAYGLNVSNLISAKTVGFQDSLDFSQLPIPFFCVASDMVSCKAKYWTSGPINTALRSTMSIPVLFEPVRYQDMILIDGGTRNNYPTDLARMMGADIIIGCVLSDSDLTYAQINNLADMVWQVIDMLGREAYSGNVRNTDVYLHPDVHEFNMLSFGKVEIDTILHRGYASAQENAELISQVRAAVGTATARKPARKALDLYSNAIEISSIEFAGVDALDAGTLRSEVRISEGDIVMNDEIDAAVARLFSLDAFEAVSYNLYEDGDAYRLVFNCVKGPVHRLGVAVRADSEELVAAMLNVGFNVNRLRGSRFDLEARLGNHLYGVATYSLTAPKLPTFNFAVKGSYTNASIYRSGNQYKAGYWRNGMDVFLSGLRMESLDFRVGAKFERFSLNSWLTDSGVAVPKDQMKLFSENFGTVYAGLRHYTLDDLYYPSKGVNIGAEIDWSAGAKVMALDMRGVIRLGSWLSLIPSLRTRTVVDNENDNLYLLNFVGGDMAGRYIDSQMPFCGFTGTTPLEDNALVAGLDLRAKLARNVYLTLQGGYVADDPEMFEKLSDLKPSCLGSALEIAYDSIVGPLKAKVQWSDVMGWGVYAGFGFDF